jgi:hypothetical protein
MSSLSVITLMAHQINQYTSLTRVTCTSRSAPAPLGQTEHRLVEYSRFFRVRNYWLQYDMYTWGPDNAFALYFTTRPAQLANRSMTLIHHGSLWPDEREALFVVHPRGAQTLWPHDASPLIPDLSRTPLVFINKETGRQFAPLFCEVWCIKCGTPTATFCLYLPYCGCLSCSCRMRSYHDAVFLRIISHGLIGRFAFRQLYVPTSSFTHHSLFSL